MLTRGTYLLRFLVTTDCGFFPKHRYMLGLQNDSLACFYNLETEI
jgi:hypothetical protein